MQQRKPIAKCTKSGDLLVDFETNNEVELTYSHDTNSSGAFSRRISCTVYGRGAWIRSKISAIVTAAALASTFFSDPALSQAPPESTQSTSEFERLNRVVATSIKSGKTEVARILLEDLIRSSALDENLRTSLEKSAVNALATLHTSDVATIANAYEILGLIRPESTQYQEKARLYREAEERNQVRIRKENGDEYNVDSNGVAAVNGSDSSQRHLTYLVYSIIVLGSLGITYYALKGILAFINAVRQSIKSGEAKKLGRDIVRSGTEITTIFSDAGARIPRSVGGNAHTFSDLILPYFQFLGRSTRKEFAVTILVSAFLLSLVMAIGFTMIDADNTFLNYLGAVVMLSSIAASAWISWAASARRVRDTGVNVWWTLTLLIPPLNLAAVVFLLLVPTGEFEGRGL